MIRLPLVLCLMAGLATSVACDPNSQTNTGTTNVCSATQYRTGGRCLALTVCTDAEYQTRAPTVRSDRACAPLTVCKANEFERRAPTATADRICRRLTECKPNEYETQAPDATHDRACRRIRSCDAREYEAVAPTATSDRRCEAITRCRDGEYEAEPPTATSDRVCEPIQECPEGHYQGAPAEDARDTVCLPITVCGASEYIAVPASATTDLECAPITGCSGEEYEVAPPTETSDRQCAPRTVCSGEEFEASAPTATADRVCQALTVCAEGEFVAVEPTATSDRVCEVIRWSVTSSEPAEDGSYYGPNLHFQWTVAANNSQFDGDVSRFVVPSGCFNDGDGTFILDCYAVTNDGTRVNDACRVGRDRETDVFGITFAVAGGVSFHLVLGGDVIVRRHAMVKLVARGSVVDHVAIAPHPAQEGLCELPEEPFNCNRWSEWKPVIVSHLDYQVGHFLQGCHYIDQRTCERPNAGGCIVQGRADWAPDPLQPNKRVPIIGHVRDPTNPEVVLSECPGIDRFGKERFEACGFGLVTGGLGVLGEYELEPGGRKLEYGSCALGGTYGPMTTTSPSCRPVGDTDRDGALDPDEVLALSAAGLAYDTTGTVTFECDVPCDEIEEIKYYPIRVDLLEGTSQATRLQLLRSKYGTFHWQERGGVGYCISGELPGQESAASVQVCHDGQDKLIPVAALTRLEVDGEGARLVNEGIDETELEFIMLEDGGYWGQCLPLVSDFEDGTFGDWFGWAGNGSEADFSLQDGEVVVTVQATSGAYWHIQAILEFVPLPPGDYTISFDARTTQEQGRPLIVEYSNLEHQVAHWRLEDLDATMRSFHHQFTWGGGPGLLKFSFGTESWFPDHVKAPHQVIIDNVVFDFAP